MDAGIHLASERHVQVDLKESLQVETLQSRENGTEAQILQLQRNSDKEMVVCAIAERKSC